MSYSNYPEGCTNEDIDRHIGSEYPTELKGKARKVTMFLSENQVDLVRTIIENEGYRRKVEELEINEKELDELDKAFQHAELSWQTYD